MSIAPNLPLPSPPAYTIEGDAGNGLIRIMVEGFFDLDTLSRHFAENAACVSLWRSQRRPIRVLVDAVNHHPHSPERMALVQRSIQRIYAPGDRVAVVVASNLAKMQLRQGLGQEEIMHFFVSNAAAMTWLMAYA